jgi:pimeloyl-ACP methyl ester carboxylesterase
LSALICKEDFPMYAKISRTVLTVDGIRAPLLEAHPAGAVTDEAVVFVHGNPGSGQDWVPLLERAGQLARAVAWDHPGFGQADKPAGFDYTVDGYAAHLGRCLDALGVARAHLVGHDFGGPWMLRWAAGHPDRFASATLINTGVLPGYRWHYLARIWRAPVLGELFQATATRPAFRLLLRHGNRPPLPRAFVDRMYDDMDAGTKHAILALYRATDDPGGEPARMLSAALRPLDRPALVVWGRNDPYIPVEQAERQRETFPSARVVVLDRSGHWPFVDDLEGVAGPVLKFLREKTGVPARHGGRGPAAAQPGRG